MQIVHNVKTIFMERGCCIMENIFESVEMNMEDCEVTVSDFAELEEMVTPGSGTGCNCAAAAAM